MNVTRANNRFAVKAFSLLVGCFIASAASAQAYETTQLTDNLFMLQGKGGNIGLSIGADGVFLIDDDYAELGEELQAAIAQRTDQPVRFLINTHWHGDHTGNNESIGRTGATIVAHENVRARLNSEQFIQAFERKVPATAAAGLPVITFDDEIRFHLNGGAIDVMHVAPAHTDGDAMVYFRQADVLHTGDVYFNGMYPFIDVSSGGRIDGMIAAAGKALKLTNAQTRIIPGHGALSNKSELKAYRTMLVSVRDTIATMKQAGKTREQVVAAQPTQQYDAKWGQGFMKPDQWVGIVYDSMR